MLLNSIPELETVGKAIGLDEAIEGEHSVIGSIRCNYFMLNTKYEAVNIC